MLYSAKEKETPPGSLDKKEEKSHHQVLFLLKSLRIDLPFSTFIERTGTS
ncbi:MAG: hypothetical protein JW769_05280 [Parachlamydiales bacterium]|nr:hypothetical protein [Parachlamydiales bacterium]